MSFTSWNRMSHPSLWCNLLVTAVESRNEISPPGERVPLHHLRDFARHCLAFMTNGEVAVCLACSCEGSDSRWDTRCCVAATTSIRRILGEHVLSDVHEVVGDGVRLSKGDWTAGTQLNAFPICTALHIKRCMSRCFSIHPCSHRHTHRQPPLRGGTHPPERGCG